MPFWPLGVLFGRGAVGRLACKTTCVFFPNEKAGDDGREICDPIVEPPPT
jgi:hypothetical protein